MVMAMARDIRAGLSMEEWKFCMLTTTMVFQAHDSDDSVYWAAARLRQEIGAQYESMYPTTVSHQAARCVVWQGSKTDFADNELQQA